MTEIQKYLIKTKGNNTKQNKKNCKVFWGIKVKIV